MEQAMELRRPEISDGGQRTEVGGARRISTSSEVHRGIHVQEQDEDMK